MTVGDWGIVHKVENICGAYRETIRINVMIGNEGRERAPLERTDEGGL